MQGTLGFILSGPQRPFLIQEPCRYSIMNMAKKRRVGFTGWMALECCWWCAITHDSLNRRVGYHAVRGFYLSSRRPSPPNFGYRDSLPKSMNARN